MQLLSIEDLAVHYFTLKGDVKAVDGVSFHVDRGEVLGLAGESGCGKTTAAQAIMRIIPAPGRITRGHIFFANSDLVSLSEEAMRRVRWKCISMVFQGAMNSLNPVLSIGEQIAEAIVTHEGEGWAQARARAKRLLGLVGIDPSRANDFPHEFSGGMKQRAVIAMALACNPDIVIADEPSTALDVLVQARILELMKQLKKELNISMILISHDLSIIANMCDNVAIMYAGKIVEQSSVKEVFHNPKHPYTQMLLEAFPSLKGSKKLVSIPGDPPNLLHPPSGCRFHPRCPYAFDRCRQEEPEPLKVAEKHLVSCHFVEE
jgi:peptide/nickel transport system ATP-binding protein